MRDSRDTRNTQEQLRDPRDTRNTQEQLRDPRDTFDHRKDHHGMLNQKKESRDASNQRREQRDTQSHIEYTIPVSPPGERLSPPQSAVLVRIDLSRIHN